MFDPIPILRDAPADERRLAAVRRRVLERVAGRGPGPGRWVLAGALASGLLAVWLWPSPLSLEPPAVAWTAPTRPPEWAFERIAVEARRAGHKRAARPAIGARGKPQEPEITIIAVEDDTAKLQIPTSNPDVVLYWLVDASGD